MSDDYCVSTDDDFFSWVTTVKIRVVLFYVIQHIQYGCMHYVVFSWLTM